VYDTKDRMHLLATLLKVDSGGSEGGGGGAVASNEGSIRIGDANRIKYCGPGARREATSKRSLVKLMDSMSLLLSLRPRPPPHLFLVGMVGWTKR